MEQKKIIYQFLTTQTHAVIATVHASNTPEAALIGFAEAEDLTLVIGTNATTRKYANLVGNPAVALVIGFGHESVTIQYEGTASILDGKEREEYLRYYFKKTPTAKRFHDEPNQTYIKISPRWIRYFNHSQKPAENFEITF